MESLRVSVCLKRESVLIRILSLWSWIPPSRKNRMVVMSSVQNFSYHAGPSSGRLPIESSSKVVGIFVYTIGRLLREKYEKDKRQ